MVPGAWRGFSRLIAGLRATSEAISRVRAIAVCRFLVVIASTFLISRWHGTKYMNVPSLTHSRSIWYERRLPSIDSMQARMLSKQIVARKQFALEGRFIHPYSSARALERRSIDATKIAEGIPLEAERRTRAPSCVQGEGGRAGEEAG